MRSESDPLYTLLFGDSRVAEAYKEAFCDILYKQFLGDNYVSDDSVISTIKGIIQNKDSHPGVAQLLVGTDNFAAIKDLDEIVVATTSKNRCGNVTFYALPASDCVCDMRNYTFPRCNKLIQEYAESLPTNGYNFTTAQAAMCNLLRLYVSYDISLAGILQERERALKTSQIVSLDRHYISDPDVLAFLSKASQLSAPVHPIISAKLDECNKGYVVTHYCNDAIGTCIINNVIGGYQTNDKFAFTLVAMLCDRARMYMTETMKGMYVVAVEAIVHWLNDIVEKCYSANGNLNNVDPLVHIMSKGETLYYTDMHVIFTSQRVGNSYFISTEWTGGII